MSISMHLDEYMARRGIRPDDTIVNDDPCAVFEGSVISAASVTDDVACGDDAGNEVVGELEGEPEVEQTTGALDEALRTVRDVLG